jgi:hypothetical protein
MPASHFDVKPMTGRPKFIVRHSTYVRSVLISGLGTKRLTSTLYDIVYLTSRKYALKQGNRIGVHFIKYDIQGSIF